MLIPKSLHFLYHELSEGHNDYTYALDSAEFDRHCKLFARHQKQKNGVRPEITFDDGHQSNYQLARPILNRHALRARFFITAGWIERRADCMKWSELRSVQQSGHKIGAHGWSHALLTHCNPEKLKQELLDARQHLENGLGCLVDTMSLPGGRFNKRVLDACWEAGYVEVFTSIPRIEDSQRGLRSTVGRLNVLGNVSAAWLERILDPNDSAFSRLQEKYRLKQATRRLLGDTLYEKLWAMANKHDRESHAAGTLLG